MLILPEPVQKNHELSHASGYIVCADDNKYRRSLDLGDGEDIAACFAVRHPGDGRQSDHGAIVRQRRPPQLTLSSTRGVVEPLASVMRVRFASGAPGAAPFASSGLTLVNTTLKAAGVTVATA